VENSSSFLVKYIWKIELKEKPTLTIWMQGKNETTYSLPKKENTRDQ